VKIQDRKLVVSETYESILGNHEKFDVIGPGTNRPGMLRSGRKGGGVWSVMKAEVARESELTVLIREKT
jgi:hypothetical protein